MPVFYVETVATSPIREYWKVEAANAEEAAEVYGERGECLYDEVLGEEEGRTVDTVHPEAALAGFFARQSIAAEAPAMLAALREAVARVTLANSEGEPILSAWLPDAAAILSRIDGAAPPIPAAPAPSGGIEGLPEGYAMERDQDGDPILIPPANVTIFSEPGEGWLVTADYMQGRDWNSESDVIAACCDYLRSIGREG